MCINTYAPHVEISLDNLLANVKQIRSIISSSTDIIAVVKDNSYGCGSIQIAQTLEKYGDIRFFAVARPEEAFALRSNGINSEILVLGRVAQKQLERCIKLNIILTLNDLDDIPLWTASGHIIKFHCNIDTAMHRMGLLPHEIISLVNAIKNNSNLKLDGVFTHLAKADEPGTKSVAVQREKFFSCINLLKENSINISHIHYGNSAGLMDFPMDGCTLVRPGIALYGCNPDPSRTFRLDLKPVLSLKGVVAKIKQVPAGTPLSYGGNYVTKNETHIATVTLGYAHGLPRFLGNCGNLIINGKMYGIAGNVTMDYCMVDAGSISEMKVGDEVVAIGFQGDNKIMADDIAKIGKTISYEILCNISNAIERSYYFRNSLICHKTSEIY